MDRYLVERTAGEGINIVSQSLPYDTIVERPADWWRGKEIELIETTLGERTKANFKELQKPEHKR